MTQPIPKVLIADDEGSARTILLRIVESLGWTAIQVAHGRMAMEILVCNPDIRLLILDLEMPIMDGREVLMTLGMRKKNPDFHVAVVSANVRLDEISNIMRMGADLVLPKPIKPDEARTALMHLMLGTKVG